LTPIYKDAETAKILAFFFQIFYNSPMDLEASVGNILHKKNKTLAVAESCTGGLICNRLTNVSGSSGYFLGGVISYSNKIKEDVLGVSHRSMQKYGAVSRQVAAEMAKGMRLLAGSDIALSVTGIAGPGGGTRSKPVGLVYIGLATNNKQVVKKFLFKGFRKKIKSLAADAALRLVCGHL
jgi:nicotinamide-nucleotide amidase